jgi:MoaA/NifB/PqqE/SkfB family radical SAM enzyme
VPALLPVLTDLPERWGWLELALDYRCNLRCLGCHACNDTGESMQAGTVLALLREGRQRGCSRLWLGGGEPTLRDDLPSVVRTARSLGYDDVLLQTNGMRLAYAAYRRAMLAAGVTDVRLNVKSHRAEVHDGLGRGASHSLLLEALSGLTGVAVSADVLLARSTLGDLPETVSFFAARGVRRFVLWLLSAADVRDAETVREVPSFAEIVPTLRVAHERAQTAGVALESLHTPPCTLPPELRSVFSPASSLGLVVAGPDGRVFALERSSFEGGAFVPACDGCDERGRCGGPRADYLRIHGAAAFSAIHR